MSPVNETGCFVIDGQTSSLVMYPMWHGAAIVAVTGTGAILVEADDMAALRAYLGESERFGEPPASEIERERERTLEHDAPPRWRHEKALHAALLALARDEGRRGVRATDVTRAETVRLVVAVYLDQMAAKAT